MHYLKQGPKRLNASGLSHLIIPLMIVVLCGIVGTFMLVASHAETPTAGSTTPTSGPVKHSSKKRAFIHIQTFTLTSSRVELDTQLMSRTAGAPLVASDCSGNGMVQVNGPGVEFGGSMIPSWNGSACLMNYSMSGPFKPGKYNVSVTFDGNATLTSYKHVTFHRTIPKPKAPKPASKKPAQKVIMESGSAG